MKEIKLSLVVITKNASETLDRSLKSSQGLADEIIIVDDYSTDKTEEIAKKYSAKIYKNREDDLGIQRKYALEKANGEWILILDSDEVLTDEVKEEIKKILLKNITYDGYYIYFKNHFLGRSLNHGGEDYKKLVLFRKSASDIHPALVHEKYLIKGSKVGCLENKIDHYSYRSLKQMYSKFTDYAKREAKQKRQKGEKSSLKKVILYPIHMFWSRFVTDKGYKDGFFRIPLDLGFAYMEFLTYLLLLNL